MFVENPAWWGEFRQYTRHNLTEPLLLTIALDAQRRAPKRTGALQTSIDFEVESDFSGYVGSSLHYAAAVERGTHPHVIVAHSGHTLRFVVNGQVVYAKSVRHPGTPAQPYLRPALYRRRDLSAMRRRALR